MASETRLADLCDGVFDCPHSTPVWTDHGVVVLRSQNIRNGRLDLSEPSFTDERHFADRVRRAVPSSGDLVITREAPMGEVCMLPADLRCCLGQRMVLLKPSRARVIPQFLLYALQSPSVQNQIRSHEGTGSTVSNLRIPSLESLGIPNPPLPEQRAIAHILGTLDDKIELNRQMSATLEAMARALFESWFVRFDPVRAKAEGRDTGLPAEIADLFPNSFEESEIGEVPKGWRLATVSAMTTLTKGCSYRSSELAQSRTALVTLKSFLRGGGYRRDGLKEFVGSYKPRHVFASGELAIALTDVTQNADVIGCPARVPLRTPYQTLVASPDVGILRSEHSASWQPYLYYSLLSTSIRDAVKACATGTTVLHLDVKGFGAVPLVVPADDVLAMFGAVISDAWIREDSISED